jgi:ribose-phosphate pyrophosphokinase
MERALIDLDENTWGASISSKFDIRNLKFRKRYFPDGESYFRVMEDVKGKEIVVVCSLNDPNAKILDLALISRTLRDNGAVRVGLIAPYLAYMRQDKQFNAGEGVNAKYFAEILSRHYNWLITVDPHLHRFRALEEVYSISTRVLRSAQFIADYIRENIHNPLIIGPDSESKQWVEQVALAIPAPFEVLEKIRLGDKEVKETAPYLANYQNHTPVLIDDIISTAQTLIQATKNIKKLNMKAPVCIGIHAIFADNAFADLVEAGVKDIVTCNTIRHPTNKIDVSGGLTKLL